MTIQACVIFYNDGHSLIQDCLRSIKGKVDYIVSVDGPFAEFPHLSIPSSDGSLEIAQNYSDMVIGSTTPWINQAEKRNASLNQDFNPDYFLVIDTDEIFWGDLPPELWQDRYTINFEEHFSDGMVLHLPRPRLFRNVPGLHYHLKHNHIFQDNNIPFIPNAENKDDFPTLDGCKIHHFPYKRGQLRLEKDGHYVRSRAENKIKLI